MTDLIVAVAAAGAAALTLFTGFGLATLLTPVLLLFLPVPVAIGAVAVVHLVNNVVKLGLVGWAARREVVTAFGIPGAIAAIAGATLLATLVGLPVLARYDLGGEREITPLKLVIGLVIMVVAIAELRPPRAPATVLTDAPGRPDAPVRPRRTAPLVVGGLASGFIGGLSGNQGPIRAAVLLRAGLDARAYVGTSVACAILVDIARLAVYGTTVLDPAGLAADPVVARLVIVAVVAAAAGSILASRFLHKMTIELIRRLAGGLMLVVGAGLASGLV